MWLSPEAQNGTQGRRIPRREFDAHSDWVTRWLDAAAQERVTDSAMPKSTLTPKERRVVADTLSELALDIERGTT